MKPGVDILGVKIRLTGTATRTGRIRRLHRAGLVVIFTYSLAAPAVAAGANLCEREMTASAARHGVPLGILYSIGMTESGNKGTLHPYAMNIEGRPVFAKNRADAIRRFRRARKKGMRLIDIGCMQINHHYHAKAFSSVQEMFVPARNVDYAARFLKSLRAREGSWTMAAARYHAGPKNNPAQKRYVCRVIKNIVAAGFGQWTGNAKRFCSK